MRGINLHSHNALSFIAAVRLLCLYWLLPKYKKKKKENSNVYIHVEDVMYSQWDDKNLETED
jgi:hypothetical protein